MRTGTNEAERKAIIDILAAASDEELRREIPQWFIDAHRKATGVARPPSSLAWAIVRATMNTPQEERGRNVRMRLDRMRQSKQRASDALAEAPLFAHAPPPPPPAMVTKREAAGILGRSVSHVSAFLESSGVAHSWERPTGRGGRPRKVFPRASVESLTARPPQLQPAAPVAAAPAIDARDRLLALVADGTITPDEFRRFAPR